VSNRDGRADSILVAVALAITIVGSLILAATYVATVPDLVLGVGWLLFLGGLFLAFVLGYRDSRRQNRSLLGALGGGLRTLWRWFWVFMP